MAPTRRILNDLLGGNILDLPPPHLSSSFPLSPFSLLAHLLPALRSSADVPRQLPLFQNPHPHSVLLLPLGSVRLTVCDGI